MSDATYDDWTNRETWALHLWLTNDQELYEITRERVRDELGPRTDPDFVTTPEGRAARAGEVVKELWEELTDPDNPAQDRETRVMIKDVGSACRVNWDEIGALWLSDLSQDES